MEEMVKRFFKDEEGANMVEYALLVALVGVLLIATILALTGGIKASFDDATTKLTTAHTPTAPAGS